MKFTGKYLDGVENPHKSKIYKSFNSETKAAEEDGKRTLVARITTPASDRSRDQVMSKGAVLDNFMKNPVVLFAHDYSSKPIAKCIDLKSSTEGIIATVEFPPEGTYTESDTIYWMYKNGYLNAWSIGFMPTDFEPNDDGGYTFKKWEMFEFSSVPVPDNPEALTVARSKGINVEEVAEKITNAGIEVDTTALETKSEEVDEIQEPPVTTGAAGEQEDEAPTEGEEPKEDEVKIADLTVAQFKSFLNDKPVEKDIEQLTSLAYIIGELKWLAQCFEYDEVKQETLDKVNQALEILMNAASEQTTLGQKTYALNDKVEKAGRTISSKHEDMLKEAKEHMDSATEQVKAVLSAVAKDEEEEEKSVELEGNTIRRLTNQLKKHDKNVGLTLRLLKTIERERKEVKE